MPSAVLDDVHMVQTALITVSPDRQRKSISDEQVKELARSIQLYGLIHPIVITHENVLVVGERRLKAKILLEHEWIESRYVDEDVIEDELKALEYVENHQRKDLDWKDQVEAVGKYHDIMQKGNDSWTTEMTAASFCISSTYVYNQLTVFRAMETGDERVMEASTFTSAHNVLMRDFQRSVDNEMEEFSEAEILSETEAQLDLGGEYPTKGHDPERRPKTYRSASKDIFQADVIEWAAKYKGPKFNFIHCDFPYGIDYDKSGDQAAGAEHRTYLDSAENYWALIDLLGLDNLIADSAHLMFWFSMHHYAGTKEALKSMGWKVDPFPLIWYKSDNTGLLPDPARGPRRIYETAFLASKGDRKIAKPVSNLCPYPADKRNALHQSEKPEDMLFHFFRMFVDRNSMVLDPTCGSGTSLCAATSLGAIRVTACELDEEHCHNARTRLNLLREERFMESEGKEE